MELPPEHGTWGGGIPPARRTIQLYPGHRFDWPLWESATPDWDVGYTTDPSTYFLSKDLTERIAVWHRWWLAELSDVHEDPTADEYARWVEEGHAIAAALAVEVGEYADVDFRP